MRRPPVWLMAALAFVFAVGWYCRKQISDNTFLYAGADSYGYISLADELHVNGRYALGPSPKPLSYARTPLYPIFIAAVKGDHVAEMKGGDGWWRIVGAQRWLDLLITGICAYLIGAALRGRGAGLLAQLLFMVWPFTIVFFAAAFTETLAICLTTAAFACIVFDTPRFERVRHFAAGGVAALGVLLRPDGVLVLPPILLGVWLLARERRARLRLMAWLACGFAVVFSPWPIRNLIQFGQPWFLGTRVDRFSHPVPHYGGYYSWLATWAVDQEVNPHAAWCFYDPACGPQVHTYPKEAFDSDAERAEVDRLLTLRRKELFSERVSDGFAALTWQRRLRHPVDNLIVLPATRAWNVWINDHADIRHNRVPWPAVFEPMRHHWTKVAMGFCALVLLSSLLLIRRRDTRRVAAMLAAAILLRTLFLAYFFYVEPRYTVEVMPLGLCLIAGALVLGAQKLRSPRAA